MVLTHDFYVLGVNINRATLHGVMGLCCGQETEGGMMCGGK